MLTGALVGFSIAAPVGPIGALTIRRTLADGRIAGLATGLGAATADAAFGGVAAFGLTAVTGALVAGQHWLSLLGGLFLCYLAVHILRAPVAPPAEDHKRTGLIGAYLSTLLLTLTNPATTLSFVALYGGLGLSGEADAAAAAAFVAGVFGGSALWWLLLTSGVAVLRDRLQPGGLRWVNRISAAIIAGFGIAVLLRWALAMPS